MERSVKGHVRVIKVPDGEVPLRIREKWVGVILPVTAIIGSDKTSGALTGRKLEEIPVEVYCVHRRSALDALNAVSMPAADWWWKHSSAENDFCFKATDVEVVGKIEDVVLPHFTGMLEEGVGAKDAWVNQQHRPKKKR